jgi:transposase
LIRGLMSDAEWEFFEPFVTSKTGRPRVSPCFRCHLLGNAHRCLVRDLPQESGEWNSVYQQFRRWSLTGLRDILLESAENGADDRQHRNPRPSSGGGRKRGPKVGSWPFAPRLYARTNGEGLPLAFVITGGEAHDATIYGELMDLTDR